MKRIVIMLLIACSATLTASAQQKAKNDNTPYNVKALFWDFIKSWGNPSPEVYSVNRNPNTNQIESSVKITYFVANVNTGTVRQNMSVIGEAFRKDEPKGYQILHLAPGNNETFSLKAVNENGQSATYPIRKSKDEEMWLLCTKNQENPMLRDAYAIKWELNDNKSKALGAIYEITSLRPDYYEQNMSAGIFNSNRATTAKTFKIVGRVDENIKDSLYNIYIAETGADLANIGDDDYIACVPVINKRFEWQTELDHRCVGRLRSIFPDGELCPAWINLDFVPGETYNITIHNGWFDGDQDYERRVGRYSGKSLLNARQSAGNDDITGQEVVADTVQIINGVEFIEPENQWGAQAVPVTTPSDGDAKTIWRNSISPQKQAEIMQKGRVFEWSVENVKNAYLLLGGLKGDSPFDYSNDTYTKEIYKEIIQRNKEMDKNFHDLLKTIEALNPPREDLLELYGEAYKNVLANLTEQNKAFNEIYKKTGKLTKAAQNAQNYINKLTEKYMKEASKLMAH